MLVVAGEYDVRLMDMSSGYVRTLPYHGREVDGCLLSPDGKALLVSVENQIHVYACPPQSVLPTPHSAMDAMPHLQYATCVGSSSLDQYQAYTADGDISANVGLLNRTYIDISSATNKAISSRYRSSGDIRCFGLDGDLHRLYVYSWTNKEIQVWDYEHNLVLDHLTTPYDRGAVSIQPGRDKNTAYLANGFVLTQVDLNTHAVLKSISLEEADKHHLLSVTYLIDETNDRVFVFSGDERNSQTLQTAYGIYQLSTGMKIRSDIIDNSPLNSHLFLYYGIWDEAGVILFNYDNKDKPYSLGYAALPSINHLRKSALQAFPSFD